MAAYGGLNWDFFLFPSKVNNFLENRSIVFVERTEKKRKYFTCTGYLGKQKNIDYLSQKESNVKTKKKAQFKPPFKTTKEAKADVQNQDKVDKQKSEILIAPERGKQTSRWRPSTTKLCRCN